MTRQVIADLSSLREPGGSPGSWIWRSASDVKPWARGRLARAGLLDMTVKSVDARDAAMHALFSAVHDAGLPDPLSRKGVQLVPVIDPALRRRRG